MILPEASYLERYDPLAIVGSRAYLRQPVIEPQGDAKSALWIYKQFGERLGLGDFFQYEDEEDYISQQLAPLGVTLDDIRAQGYVELPTDGEASRASAGIPPAARSSCISETLARVGFPGVPTWQEPPEPPQGQFYLLTGKVAQATQFASQNNQLLHKYADEPRMWMNDNVAADRGLADGDWVEVASEVGHGAHSVAGDPRHSTRLCLLTPGYGHLSKGLTTAFGIGASDSVLHVTYTDPASGSQALSQTFVTVRKA